MTQLYFTDIEMPGAELGGENPLPDFGRRTPICGLWTDQTYSAVPPAGWLRQGENTAALSLRCSGKHTPESRFFSAVRREVVVLV